MVPAKPQSPANCVREAELCANLLKQPACKSARKCVVHHRNAGNIGIAPFDSEAHDLTCDWFTSSLLMK